MPLSLMGYISEILTVRHLGPICKLYFGLKFNIDVEIFKDIENGFQFEMFVTECFTIFNLYIYIFIYIYIYIYILVYVMI